MGKDLINPFPPILPSSNPPPTFTSSTIYKDPSTDKKSPEAIAEKIYNESNNVAFVVGKTMHRLFSSAQKDKTTIANKYIEEGNYEKAIEIANEMFSSTSHKEQGKQLMRRLAPLLIKEGNYDAALDLVRKFSWSIALDLSYHNYLIGKDLREKKEPYKALPYLRTAFDYVNRDITPNNQEYNKAAQDYYAEYQSTMEEAYADALLGMARMHLRYVNDYLGDSAPVVYGSLIFTALVFSYLCYLIRENEMKARHEQQLDNLVGVVNSDIDLPPIISSIDKALQIYKEIFSQDEKTQDNKENKSKDINLWATAFEFLHLQLEDETLEILKKIPEDKIIKFAIEIFAKPYSAIPEIIAEALGSTPLTPDEAESLKKVEKNLLVYKESAIIAAKNPETLKNMAQGFKIDAKGVTEDIPNAVLGIIRNMELLTKSEIEKDSFQEDQIRQRPKDPKAITSKQLLENKKLLKDL